MKRFLRPAALRFSGHLPFRLPVEILDDAPRRLGYAAFGIGFAILASGTWMLIVDMSGRGRCPAAHLAIYALGTAGAVGFYRLTKCTGLSLRTLLDAGLCYEVLVALCTALLEETSPLSHGRLAGLSWVTVLIVFFPVVVPATPLRTMLAGTAAAAAGWLGARLAQSPTDALLLWNNGVAVVLSVIPSLVVSRLGEQLEFARELGQYTLEEKLGQGSMGEVWRASHRFLRRPAAVKMIHPEALGNVEDWRRFRQEAWVTAQLTSPHTVTVYDFGESQDGNFYLAMELLDGLDLEKKVQRDGPLAPDLAVAILMQVCRSLEEAHAREMVHRDIKPSNLFLCQVGLVNDFVKVLDFGLVVSSREGEKAPAGWVEQGTPYGTPEYIAPEQATGSAIDGRADLYALGGVAYWLLTGEPVFAHRSRAEVLLCQLREDPPPLAARISGVRISAQLESIVARCLEKSPELRPGSAGELWRQLSQCPEAIWHQAHVSPSTSDRFDFEPRY